jgi:hypothetical protein
MIPAFMMVGGGMMEVVGCVAVLYSEQGEASARGHDEISRWMDVAGASTVGHSIVASELI